MPPRGRLRRGRVAGGDRGDHVAVLGVQPDPDLAVQRGRAAAGVDRRIERARDQLAERVAGGLRQGEVEDAVLHHHDLDGVVDRVEQSRPQRGEVFGRVVDGGQARRRTSIISRACISSCALTSLLASSRPTPMERTSDRCAGVGWATKLPPVTPRVVTMRFWLARSRRASRTVLRLTPVLAHNWGSVGSRSPGRRWPDVICSRRESARTWYAGGRTETLTPAA